MTRPNDKSASSVEFFGHRNMRLNLLLLLLAVGLTNTIIFAQETKPPLLPPRGVTLLLETEMSCRHYIKNPTKPKYPEKAKEAGIEGEVLNLFGLIRTAR